MGNTNSAREDAQRSTKSAGNSRSATKSQRTTVEHMTTVRTSGQSPAEFSTKGADSGGRTVLSSASSVHTEREHSGGKQQQQHPNTIEGYCGVQNCASTTMSTGQSDNNSNNSSSSGSGSNSNSTHNQSGAPDAEAVAAVGSVVSSHHVGTRSSSSKQPCASDFLTVTNDDNLASSITSASSSEATTTNSTISSNSSTTHQSIGNRSEHPPHHPQHRTNLSHPQKIPSQPVECGQRKPVLNAYSQSLNDRPSQDFTRHIQFTNDAMANDSSVNPMLQTVFKWDQGGREVFVTGTFTDWKPIKMVQSQGDFFTVVDVPEGHHQYKFIVDGHERTDPNSELDDARHSNTLEVKKSDFEVFEALQNDIANEEKNKSDRGRREPIVDLSGSSPPGVYSQEIPTSFESHSRSGKTTNPPVLPPYLLEVILNNPKSFHDKILLPQPNHVMLNHLYALSIQDGVMVMSDINRYRNKYVTTLFYKPI